MTINYLVRKRYLNEKCIKKENTDEEKKFIYSRVAKLQVNLRATYQWHYREIEINTFVCERKTIKKPKFISFRQIDNIDIV